MPKGRCPLRMERLRQSAWVLIVSLALSACAFAQDSAQGNTPSATAKAPATSTATATSRADSITAAESEKAKHLSPQKAPAGEEKFDQVQTSFLDRLFDPNGPGIKFGGIPTGGGFSLGPMYNRRDMLAGHLDSSTFAVGSTKKWYGGQSSLHLHDLLDGHLELTTDGGYQNAASVWYFGEGPDTYKKNKTDFGREFTTVHFGAKGHFFDQKLTLGYTLGGLFAHVVQGNLSGTPTTQKLFTDADTPGLGYQSNFITGTTIVELDFRKVGFSNPRGLLIEADDSQLFDESGPNSNFHLLQTQGTYYLPFTNGIRSFVFRVRNVSAFAERNQIVPFYLQPTLGGPEDLRGFDRYRFYGNGSSLASGEYRWSVSQTLEMALFGDGGNIYSRPGLIGFRNLQGDAGLGFRIKNKQTTVMRCDVGFSREGVHVWFVFDDAFSKLSRTF
jgi:hypothetical protein